MRFTLFGPRAARRSWTVPLAAGLALSTVLALTSAAQADHRPLPSRAQVAAAQATATRKAGAVAAIEAQLVLANARLDAAAQQAEIATEQYNGAIWHLQQATAATAAARAHAAAAQAQVASERAGIADLVTQSYQQGSALDGVNALMGAGGPEGVMNRWGAVQGAADSMQARFDQYTALSGLSRLAAAKAAKAQADQAVLARQAAALRNQAAAAANSAQSQAAAIAVQRHKLIAELASAQRISVSLATARQQGLERIARQKAAQAAAAAAVAAAKAAAAAAQAAQSASNNSGGQGGGDPSMGPVGGWNDPGLPTPAGTSAGAARAIAFARSQLGKPYVWGAAGPDSWDCSGLTMMAWQAGGVSLPHYTVAQYHQTKHITVDQLRPGDLVFWGSSPDTIHHVALYIGNGQIIQAPRTGEYVEVSGLYDWIPPDYYGRP